MYLIKQVGWTGLSISVVKKTLKTRQGCFRVWMSLGGFSKGGLMQAYQLITFSPSCVCNRGLADQRYIFEANPGQSTRYLG